MRYRIDGVLYEMVPPPKHLGPAITSRVKVMANLDIAERRLPQDGRIELTVGGQPGRPPRGGAADDVRRERGDACARPVERRARAWTASGSVRTTSRRSGRLIRKPNGIVVVTGPTGSGKTTTLYAALAELNDIETKILTAEDPVEYDIDGLCQCAGQRRRWG
jgi:type IV pilus assembly protein PilB